MGLAGAAHARAVHGQLAPARLGLGLVSSVQVAPVRTGHDLADSGMAVPGPADLGVGRLAPVADHATTTAGLPGGTATRATVARRHAVTATRVAGRQGAVHRSALGATPAMTRALLPDVLDRPAISCTAVTPSWRRSGPADRFVG